MSQRNGAMVAIDGPATLAAGERATYTLRISRTDMGTLAGAGLDVRASGGGLRPNGTDTRIESCELTHNAVILPAMAGAGEVRIPFDFIAPASSTTVTLQAAGNAVDGNGSIAGMPGQTGDQWGTASLMVTITGTSDAGGTCLPDPVADAGPDASADGSADAGASTGDASVDATSQPDVVSSDSASDASSLQDAAADGGTQPPAMTCRCTVAGHGAGRGTPALWLVLGALGLAWRARNRRA
jgi:MYXO-CTERM domain-containing protein